jgi:hypothetical protein
MKKIKRRIKIAMQSDLAKANPDMFEIWEELITGVYPSDALMEKKRLTNGAMLDRHDLNGIFGPGNCFWTTYEEYVNRRRTNN